MQITNIKASSIYQDYRPFATQNIKRDEPRQDVEKTQKGLSSDSSYYEISGAYRITFSKEALSLYGNMLSDPNLKPIAKLSERDYLLMDSIKKSSAR